MIIRFSLLFIIPFLFSYSSLLAQVSAPKYVNEFLAIGVDAKGISMSNSMVEHVGDVTSGYWNPAGLSHIKDKYSFSLMHASYFAGIANYNYAAFATPIDKRSHLGVSVIRFAVDDIPDTRFLFDANGRLNYDNVQSFSVADYAFLFSYARRFPLLKDIRLGANFKIIHRNVGQFANAWGFGLDLGAQMELSGWNFGIMARDITGTFNAWRFNPATFQDVFSKTGNTIPDNSLEVALPRLILGAGKDMSIISSADKGEILGIMLSLGADLTFDGERNTVLGSSAVSIDPHAGVEFQVYDVAFLRGGIGNFQYIKDFDGSQSLNMQPNFGLGFAFQGFTIDYALTDITNQSVALYSHVVSLKGTMGVSKNKSPRYKVKKEQLFY